MTDFYYDINSLVINNVNTVMVPTVEERHKIVESVRQQLRIQHGMEKRWEQEELPKLQKLCAQIRIHWMPDGTAHVAAADPNLQATMVAYGRGTSWFSSVDLIGAVSHALEL